MDIDEKTSQTNMFSGGMDTDTSDMLLKDNQYRLAKNLRYITDTDENTGELHMIDGAKKLTTFKETIIATATIRDIGVIVSKGQNGWSIYVFKEDENINPKLIFGPCKSKIGDKISIVMRYEDNNNVKAYLADGINPLMMATIEETLDEDGNCTGEFKFIGNEIIALQAYNNGILLPPLFCGWVPGQLTSGLVQYAYMLYHRHGKSTIMSPITKLIELPKNPDATGKDLQGEKQGKETSCGVKLKINIEDAKITSYFDRILVYRIKYDANGQTPTVSLIVDEVRNTQSNTVTIQDVGQNPLSQLTLEEFNNISGIHIVPKIIESKNDYLFAANIQDITYNNKIGNGWDSRAYQYHLSSSKLSLSNYNEGTQYTGSVDDVPDDYDCYNEYNNINNQYQPDGAYYTLPTSDGKQYFGGTGKNIEWRFVVTRVDADTCRYEKDDKYYSRTAGSDGMFGTRYNMQSLDKANTFNKDDNGNVQLSAWYIRAIKNPNQQDPKNRLTYQYQLEAAEVEPTDLGISIGNNDALNYSNPIVSYALKSLRRGELYRYGIVLYDENNHPSPVKWIADIRVPDQYVNGFETFLSHDKYGDGNIDLSVRPIGIEFKIKNLPDNVSAYEIVRCNRSLSDISTISQGVLSRPTRRRTTNKSKVNDYAYGSNGFLTTGKFIARWTYSSKSCIYTGYEEGWNIPSNQYIADNICNDGLFSFVSPEVSYLKDTLNAYLKNKVLYIDTEKYIFGKSLGYKKNNKVPQEFNSDAVDPKELDYDKDDYDNGEYIIKPAITNLNLTVGAYGKSHILPDHIKNKDAYNYYPFNTAIMFIADNALREFYSAEPWVQIEPSPMASNRTLKFGLTGTYRDPSNKEYTGSLYPESVAELQKQDPYIKHSKDNDQSYRVLYDIFAYIKLYEQSNDVFAYKHKDIPGTYQDNAEETDNKRTSMEPLVPEDCWVRRRFNIDAFKQASELNWDDTQTQTKDSKGHQQFSWTYADKQDAVGKYNYNNYVSWFLTQDESKYKSVGTQDYQHDYVMVHEGAMPMATGGRCLMLAIDTNKAGNPNILADTCGAINAAYRDTDSGNINYKIADIDDAGIIGQLYDYYGSSKNPYNVYAESAFGTFIVNLKHNVIPYGGYDYQSRTLNTYYSYGDYHKVTGKNTTCCVFDGDCYIEPFEYVSAHKIFLKQDGYTGYPTFSIIYSIPLETNINLALTNGFEFSRNYQTQHIASLQIEPSNVNGMLIQDDPLYDYNSVYSQNPTSKLFAAQSENVEELSTNNLDYRVYYSNKKTNDERRDSWLVFMPANYLDVDTRYGQITELRTFHNQLLFWQEQASGVLSVNERVQIADDSNLPLILGTGGVLSRYDYFSSMNGMKPNQFVDTQSDNQLIWWDGFKRELCLYNGDGGQVQVLSKVKSVQNYINSHNDVDNPHLIYDKKFNEFILNIVKDGSLVYSELPQQFSGVYTILPKYSFVFNDKLLLVDNNQNISKWNQNNNNVALDIAGNEITPSLKYVINKSGQFVKVFDQAEMGGRFYKGNTNKLHLKFATPLMQSGNIEGNKISNREYSFRYDIPRENGAEWGRRLRGKTMQVELFSNSNSTDFSIQYVTTKFRMSWS